MNGKKENKSNFGAGMLIGAAIGVAGAFLAKALFGSDSKEKEKEKEKQTVEYNQVQANQATTTQNNNDDVTELFECPITSVWMVDPYITKCGHSFEKNAILECLSKRQVCPICNVPCTDKDIFPNFALRQTIENWKNTKKQ